MRKDDKAIHRLQRELSVLRNIAGWSATELANRLCVSRQTIANIESGKGAPMTMIQYLAIRTLLEDEVREKNNSLLDRVMKTLIDDDVVSEEERESIRTTVSTVNSHIGNRSGTVVRSQKVNELLPDVIEKGKAWVEEYFSKH